MDKLFRFLFKYPPLDVSAGRFHLGPVAAGAAGRRGRRPRSRSLALLTYRGVSAADRPRDRVVLVGLRLAALAVLLFCLFRPTLDPEGRGAAAEFPRRPDRRLAQHDDRRSRRPAAQRVRPAAVRTGRTRSCSPRCRSASSCGSSASRRRPTASASAARPEVRRHRRRASGRRSIARATSWPGCRSPAW